jgi:hypothetical protein
VLGLGWGVRVAQAVNNPEMGNASIPIRIQLRVLDDCDDDEDEVIIFSNLLPLSVFGYLLK